MCADLDKKKIEGLNNGVLPIYEPGLDEMVARNVAQNRLTFSADPVASIKDVDVVFVAVGTPSRSDGGAHLGYVDDVAKMVADNLTKEVVVVLKSTVPVGTNKRVRNIVKGMLISLCCICIHFYYTLLTPKYCQRRRTSSTCCV